MIVLASKFGAEMTTADSIFARALLGLVLLEFFADQQQWSTYSAYLSWVSSHLTNSMPSIAFQEAKKLYKKTAKVPQSFTQADLDRGFVITGLWSWSRHPNFAAEQAIWVVLYQWGCWTSDVLYNWTLLGAMSYLILFQGSTWFTEALSAAKYPEYKEYQQRVGMFLPRLGTDIPGDIDQEKPTLKGEKKPVTGGKK